MDILSLKQSATTMTDEELINHINELRRNRRTVASEPRKKKAKVDKPMTNYSAMSVDVLEMLLNAMEGE